MLFSAPPQMEVSPLENAIYVVENKTQELRTLISQYQHRQHHGNINPLSMCLNGVIDAAVNGGIARYQEAFFDKDYISGHPEDTERITHLKDLMQEQVRLGGGKTQNPMIGGWDGVLIERRFVPSSSRADRCTFSAWAWRFTRSWCTRRCVPCTRSWWTSST